MSVSAVAPTPFYQDPDRLQIGLPQASAAKTEKAADGDKRLSMFAESDDEPSFWDVLDIVNPLQHIPIINDIYRDMTGDKIGVGARLVGGTLFGGPIGLIAAAANCVVEESTGKDMGEHVLALFRDEQPASPDAPAPTMVASAATAPASSSPAPAEVAAPVIALPETAAVAGASQPMVFSLDGMQAANPAAAAAQPAPTQVARAEAVAATAKPMPLTGPNARFMATPARKATDAAPLPPITVPVSSGTARSNVPVTGRNTQAATVAPTAQRTQAGQENVAGHPMLPPTDANGQTAASPDWFTAAWSQALDKYQRSNQRNDKVAPGSTTSVLE
jgi:hypothetical protein